MSNVNQFTANHYITKATILEVGEEVWQKMREWADENGYKCLKRDYAKFEDIHDWIGCCVNRHGRFCFYSDLQRKYIKEFTAQDILSLLNINKQEEKENMQQFKAMKFRVKDKEHSEHIQKWLFEQGYKWHNGASVQYTDAACLTTNDDSEIRWTFESVFDILEKQEMSFTYTEHTSYTYECVPVHPAKPVVKLVEIGGKQYKEQDILTILNSGFVNIYAVEGEVE